MRVFPAIVCATVLGSLSSCTVLRGAASICETRVPRVQVTKLASIKLPIPNELGLRAERMASPSAQYEELHAASPDVDAFVRHALLDRWAARDIPDIGLLAARRRVFVLREMFHARLLLSAKTVPRTAGTEFEFVALTELQANARRSRDVVYFIALDDPDVRDDAASVTVGVDLVAPAEPAITTCCCTTSVHYVRRDGRWAFVKSNGGTCS